MTTFTVRIEADGMTPRQETVECSAEPGGDCLEAASVLLQAARNTLEKYSPRPGPEAEKRAGALGGLHRVLSEVRALERESR